MYIVPRRAVSSKVKNQITFVVRVVGDLVTTDDKVLVVVVGTVVAVVDPVNGVLSTPIFDFVATIVNCGRLAATIATFKLAPVSPTAPVISELFVTDMGELMATGAVVGVVVVVVDCLAIIGFIMPLKSFKTTLPKFVVVILPVDVFCLAVNVVYNGFCCCCF